MNRRTRILYIGNKLSGAGTTPTTIDTLGPRLESEGIEIRYASSVRHTGLRLLHMLLSIIRYRRYDYVLIDTYSTNAFYFAWSSALLSRLLKIKYAPILHGGNLPQRFKSSPSMCRQIFLHSHTNIAVSPYLLQVLKERSYKHTLIPNSVDIAKYPFTKRESFQPRLLWVRAFDKIYNPEMAVRAMSSIVVAYPKATLTMVGPDKDGSLLRCKAMALELGLEHNIIFTGKLHKEQWIVIAKDHDFFINTSRFDNLPVSVIEAMALGLPVISTNVGGLPFFIEDGKDGILVNNEDSGAMADAVKLLLANNEKATQLAINARTKAESFDWSTIKHRWVDLLRNPKAS